MIVQVFFKKSDHIHIKDSAEGFILLDCDNYCQTLREMDSLSWETTLVILVFGSLLKRGIL